VKKRILIVLVLLAIVALPLGAHDLFLKLDSYFVAPNSDVAVKVLNGTFTTSENGVTRDRLADLTLVAPDTVVALDTTTWTATKTWSLLRLRTRGAGVYVVGASTRPRELRLEAKEFNAYLKEEGILDVLDARTTSGALGKAARERYSKHVKAVFQAGATSGGQYGRVLGYPAEIVPLTNPYQLRPGMTLRVRCLADGAPAAGQIVLAGGRTPNGTRLEPMQVTADSTGEAKIQLRSRGTFYVKFIRMRPVTGSSSVDYESKWATLTFAVR
jgi:hypothetical protein